jgi:hypothetical protein
MVTQYPTEETTMKRLTVTASLLLILIVPATALARGGTGGGGGGVTSTPPTPGAPCYQWNEKGIGVVTARATIVMQGNGDLLNCSDHDETVWFRVTNTGPNPHLTAPVFDQNFVPPRPLAATTIKPSSKLAYQWFLNNPAPSSVYEVKITAVDAGTGLDATSAVDEFVTPPA